MLLPAALLAALAMPSQANSELDFSHQYRYEGTGEVEHPNSMPSPNQVESNNSVSGDIYSDKRTITVGNLNNNSGNAYSSVDRQEQVRRYSNEQLKNNAEQHRIPAYEDLSRASRSIHGESYGPNHYQWSTSTNDSGASDDYYNQYQTKPAPPPSEYGQNARPSPWLPEWVGTLDQVTDQTLMRITPITCLIRLLRMHTTHIDRLIDHQ